MRAIEMLARLGPHGMRLDGAGGGRPLIGRDEVIDALAAVKDPVGQALLRMTARLAVRDDSALVRRDAWRELDEEQERRTQLRAEEERRQRRHIIDTADLRGLTFVQRALVRKQYPPLWPEWGRCVDRWRALVPGVIAELTDQPIACPLCKGTRTIPLPTGEGFQRCPKCHGNGLNPHSPRQRGKVLGVTRTAFNQAWEPPWSHLASYLANAMQNAATDFDRRIRANKLDAAA
ncbi:MAG: hypothetical protein KDI51_01395 [Xanthomonadales bacterium]|nr:hypothetical protein [Xanthomonadales bacterium]MCB1633208.1 hypothetical protein [Xanthomonadales bacterium]